MTACKGTRKDGSPCGMRPGTGQEFCLNHGGKAADKAPKVQAAGESRKEATGKAASSPRHASSGAAAAWGVVVGLALTAGLLWAGHRYLLRQGGAAGAVRHLTAVG